MSAIFKMILAVLFLFCIIANTKTNNQTSEAEIAYTPDYQTNTSTVDFTKHNNTPGYHYANY